MGYGPFGTLVVRTGTTSTPYLYGGMFGVETDPNGLLYMRARYYHPLLRRFVSPDPIGFAGGLNWYVYAGNNPYQFGDPTGLGPQGLPEGGLLTQRLRGWVTGLQFVLDVTAASEVPGVSQVAGLASGVISAGQGDWLGAGLAAAGVVPGVGLGADAARLGRWGARSLEVASSVGPSASMQTVRIIQKGEKIDDIINEAKALTFMTGNEHALVKLANGNRALVSGGPGGIRLPRDQIQRIYGHTHPTAAPPSAADFRSLQELGQSKQYIFHGGQVTIIRPQH
jgi:RHS repeat-associated protein